jgi:hypothetical protein
MSRLLPFLPALACPLLMLLCLAGMRRMSRPSEQVGQEAATADRVGELERALAALRAERQRPGQPNGQAQPLPQDGPPRRETGYRDGTRRG